MFNTIYRSIPFLYEINTLLEWTTTKTVLRMDQWFSAEEMHRVLTSSLFSVVAREGVEA